MTDDEVTQGEGDSPVPAGAGTPGADGDAKGGVPEVADRRLRSESFSSGLSVPDFAACLQMGIEPVALVQGFCVMRWGWYGAGSPYMRGVSPYATGGGTYVSNYRCPHGFVSTDHRTWGQNYEQSWVEEAWSAGFGSAYQRMLDEATEAGAHGIVGVADTTRHLGDLGVTEFHIVGTAVVVRDGDPPPGGVPWSTYLAGQRLAKLFEAGFVPVSVAATLSSVRVWAYCMTEYLMEDGTLMWTSSNMQEAGQVVDAHMASYQIAREHVRSQLGGDLLQGARMQVQQRNLGEGDEVVECRLVGTRVRRFKDVGPIAPPLPTVRLS
ncbi:MAG TPA: heavy metal-binding domain-containing protein [Acidimicrobiales bacterium]|nr:heavy metal-binding domain-containing protein [Acidimicrobiales bacterium]